MTRDELDKLEQELIREIDRRQRLGAYGPDASSILQLFEIIRKIIKELEYQKNIIEFTGQRKK